LCTAYQRCTTYADLCTLYIDRYDVRIEEF